MQDLTPSRLRGADIESRTVELNLTDIPEDIEALPQARGFGVVRDLREAMFSNRQLNS